ncbi:MAG TPA: HEAT repeat domain-containing protein [Gemmatimonadaceae bacterium]|jgi:hypothetical protein
MRRIATLWMILAGVSSAGAQSVMQRVAAAHGSIQLVYPSRTSACGDGKSFIGNVLGTRNFFSDGASFSKDDDWRPACVHGPVRVVATVIDGEVTRLRTYVGPASANGSDVESIQATAADVASWLTDLVVRGSTRAASDAMLPLIVADIAEPWPLLLRVARDDSRPRDVRQAAITWLGSGAAEHLGLADASNQSDDDDVRAQAVFVLSQRPKSESVPELIELARTAKNAAVRRAAIFWLGQSGDARAMDVYAELLGIK